MMKARMILTAALATSLSLLSGCMNRSVDEVLAELKGPEYLQATKARQHVIELRYIPKLLTVLEGARPDGALILTKKAVARLSNRHPVSNGMLFVMHLAPRDPSASPDFHNDVVYGNLSGYGSYQEALHEYAFGLKEKIWIEVGGMKVPLASYQMENSYGMTRGRYFTLMFPDISSFLKNNDGRFEVVLDDIVPGLARRKITWTLPVGKYDNAI